MSLILKKTIFDLIIGGHAGLRYDRPKKCPTFLYGVNLWLKQVSATGANDDLLPYAVVLLIDLDDNFKELIYISGDSISVTLTTVLLPLIKCCLIFLVLIRLYIT